MVKVPIENQIFKIGPNTKPALTVPDGAIVTFQTIDCFSEKITCTDETFESCDEIRECLGELNPINGPVAIEGAKEGDFIDIEIISIDPEETGISAYIPNMGLFSKIEALFSDILPDTRICEIRDNIIRMPTTKKSISSPIKPMVGTLWSAPKIITKNSYIFDSEHLGNIDCTDVTIGSKVRLPVSVDGALVGVGDVHAIQGQGEILGVAVEVSSKVKIRFSVIKNKKAMYCDCPQVNSDKFIGSVGCSFGKTLTDNIKLGYFDLFKRLIRFYGYSKNDAYHLLGQFGEVNVCQLLGKHQAAIVKISKSFL